MQLEDLEIKIMDKFFDILKSKQAISYLHKTINSRNFNNKSGGKYVKRKFVLPQGLFFASEIAMHRI